LKIARTAVAVALVVPWVASCVYSVHSAHWTVYRYQFPPPPPPPPPIQELVITEKGATAPYPQYWQRNTLLVDLQGISGTGRLVLRPHEGKAWPVRLAFRVMPGSVGVLEVYADQRSIFPITPELGKPIELELDPGVYSAKTEQISISWRPAT
jgi:hypothetical protein